MGRGISAMKIFESVEIPTFADKKARWEVKVDLSSKRYSFYVSYNTRQEAWVMSISDTNGNLLIAGIRLVPGIRLLKKYRATSPDLPPGELVLVDIEGKPSTAEVTRTNLSNRFALTYMVTLEV
jgi:hypothetical protein